MIREAKPSDIEAILEIAVESVSNNPLPVRICRTSMSDTIRAAISGKQHFVWVAEKDGEVVAAVGAMSQPSFWFERQQCSVLLYYSRVPNLGAQLIRQLVRWVKSRPVIKVLVLELEPEADPRLISFLKRLGLSRESTNLCYVRGMTNE